MSIDTDLKSLLTLLLRNLRSTIKEINDQIPDLDAVRDALKNGVSHGIPDVDPVLRIVHVLFTDLSRSFKFFENIKYKFDILNEDCVLEKIYNIYVRSCELDAGMEVLPVNKDDSGNIASLSDKINEIERNQVLLISMQDSLESVLKSDFNVKFDS